MNRNKIKNVKNGIIESVHYIYGHLYNKQQLAVMFDQCVKDEDFAPKEIKVEESLDVCELFGKTPEELCAYFKQLEKQFGVGTFEQKWSGYEDNYFVYEHKGFEDDDSIENRIYKIVIKYVDDKALLREKELAKEKRIKELEAELAKLKSKNTNK